MTVGHSKFMSALWGGLFIMLISVVPGLNFVNCLCCSGVVGGGILAVYAQSKKIPASTVLTPLNGVELGLLAGLIGTMLSAVVILVLVPHLPSFLSELETLIDQRDLRDLQEIIDPAMATRGLSLTLIAVSLVMNVLFATLGGLIGVSIFGGEKKRSALDAKNDPDDSIIVEDIDF